MYSKYRKIPLGDIADVDKTALVETRELHRKGDNGFLIVSIFCAGYVP